jgi:hypothetical protein
LENTKKSVGIPEIWNFMVREISLSPDMSVFLYDSNQNLEELLVPIFEILYSLAEYLNDRIKNPAEIKIDDWIEKIKSSSFIRIHRNISKTQLYFLYWPVILAQGGDRIAKNIGEALQLYYSAIKYLSPFERLGHRPDRYIMANMPNWNKLPKQVKSETLRKQITGWARQAYKKSKNKHVG